jgi:hypothetical protein
VRAVRILIIQVLVYRPGLCFLRQIFQHRFGVRARSGPRLILGSRSVSCWALQIHVSVYEPNARFRLPLKIGHHAQDSFFVWSDSPRRFFCSRSERTRPAFRLARTASSFACSHRQIRSCISRNVQVAVCLASTSDFSFLVSCSSGSRQIRCAVLVSRPVVSCRSPGFAVPEFCRSNPRSRAQ